jgi:hypothetical protein
MTITYNLAPLPKQRYFYPDDAAYGTLAKQPLAGGKVYTYSSQNHATPKAAYQSNMGTPPPAHTNPIILDQNGEAPIYWALDDEDLTDLYYIEVYDPDSSPGDGSPIYTADDYDGAGFSGSSTTTAQIDFNFIKNAQFSFPWFKLQYNLKYDGTATLPIQVGSWVGAEWGFAKNNTSATDTIEYVEFASGQTSVPYNPIHYLEWTLGAQGSSETFKVISQRLDNTDNIFTPNIFGGQNSVQQFSA